MFGWVSECGAGVGVGGGGAPGCADVASVRLESGHAPCGRFALHRIVLHKRNLSVGVICLFSFYIKADALALD